MSKYRFLRSTCLAVWRVTFTTSPHSTRYLRFQWFYTQKKKKREGLGLYNTCMSPSFCFSCSRECAALRWGNVVLQLSTNIYIYISKHLFLYYIVHFLKKKVLITFTSDPVHSRAKKKKTEKTSKERERKPTVHRRKCSTTLRTDRTTELLDE